jgi:tetratricopeptide (TPR) repeat protein
MSNPQISEKIYEVVENTKNLELTGQYHEAVELLSPYWQDLNEFPNTSGLNADEQAEILLRCGSLAGFIGSCNQIRHSQEKAKDFLTNAREIFLALENDIKVAECETYLASTDLRLGSVDEAKIWLNHAFEHDISRFSETRFHSHIIEFLVLLAEKNYNELVEKCEQLEPHFRAKASLYLQGDFNTNYALGLMRIGEKKKAFERFELSKHFLQKIGHKLYEALVENNLAVFYQNEKMFFEAHQSAKNSIALFRTIGERNREGYAIDTRSQIYIAEGKYAEALECSNQAVKLLESGENYCFLANALQTKSHIEFYLKQYSASLDTLIASVNIAAIHISHTQADKFRKDYAELMKTL